MNHDFLIALLVVFIVIIQIGIFTITLKKIRLFKSIFPLYEEYLMANGMISLGSTDGQSMVMDRILHSINTYLFRNRGAVSDFNLMKDIVDRNCDAADEEVNTLLPIPLYLGLMGTMLGIIIGLYSMPSIGAADFGQAIDVLIGGVKIAMISSFVGLLLTTSSSGYFYKGAKAHVEGLKNDFFTFIQTELLPVLSSDTVSVVRTFEAVLTKFSNEFRQSSLAFIDSLNGISEVSSDLRQLCIELQQMNLTSLTKTNVELLKKFNVAGGQFDKFGTYLVQVNSFIENTVALNAKIDEQLTRTISIESIAEGIGSITEENRKFLHFFSHHDHQLALNQTIADVEVAINKSMESLSGTLVKMNSEIEVKTTVLERRFEKLFEQISSDFSSALNDKKGNFDELKKLGTIQDSLQKAEESNQKQHAAFNELIKNLNELNRTIQDQQQFQLPASVKYIGLTAISTSAIIGIGYIVSFIWRLF